MRNRWSFRRKSRRQDALSELNNEKCIAAPKGPERKTTTRRFLVTIPR